MNDEARTLMETWDIHIDPSAYTRAYRALAEEKWRLMCELRESERQCQRLENQVRAYQLETQWALDHVRRLRKKLARYQGQKQRNARYNAAAMARQQHRQAVWEKSNGLCWYCGEPLDERFHVDHIVSVSRGGSDDLSNLAPACPSCNFRKNHRSPDEYKRACRIDQFWFEREGMSA